MRCWHTKTTAQVCIHSMAGQQLLIPLLILMKAPGNAPAFRIAGAPPALPLFSATCHLLLNMPLSLACWKRQFGQTPACSSE
jgi:hypothetical protein